MKNWILWVCLPLFNVLNQVALKLAAGILVHQTFGLEWLLAAALCPYIWMSLTCEVINFVTWMNILKRHSLSQAFPLTAISYAVLMLTSWFGFHEVILWQQVVGTLIIMSGIALMGFESRDHAATGK